MSKPTLTGGNEPTQAAAVMRHGPEAQDEYDVQGQRFVEGLPQTVMLRVPGNPGAASFGHGKDQSSVFLEIFFLAWLTSVGG